MINLILNELIKIFRRPGTFVMIGLLIIMIAVTGAFMKYQNQGVQVSENPQWKQTLKTENEALKKQIQQSTQGAIEQGNYFESQIALNEYRIKHDLAPNTDYNLWNFVTDVSQLIQFAGLFTITIAAGIVASEFNWGTIKLLLIRPINRRKILLSKYITVLLFGILMLGILFIFSALLGTVLFGLPQDSIPYLNYHAGKVTEQPMVIHLIVFYFLQSISMVMLTTMAFMISAVFRNSSLAIGLSLFLMFTGGQITRLIALKYEWAKYILFANTDLMQYFEGMPMVEGMTLSFSVLMLLVYFCLFQFLAFYVFQKRDVAA
jgi:ABC-2 type transport system permease protein